VSDQEMIEGWFRIIKFAHHGEPKPGVFYKRWG
jgi:hypothetical protein